jgi:hypothetical protein
LHKKRNSVILRLDRGIQYSLNSQND